MSAPENPRAFPVPYEEPGMTLRDWFAGQAMSHALAATASHDGCYDPVAAAHGAYTMADAMLAERMSAEVPAPAPAPTQSEAQIARLKESTISNIVNGTCTSCDRVEADCHCLPF